MPPRLQRPHEAIVRNGAVRVRVEVNVHAAHAQAGDQRPQQLRAVVAKVLREEVAAAHVRPHAPDGVAAVVVAVVEKRHAQRRPKKGVLGIEPFLDLNGAARGYPLGRRVAGREPLQGAPERYAVEPVRLPRREGGCVRGGVQGLRREVVGPAVFCLLRASLGGLRLPLPLRRLGGCGVLMEKREAEGEEEEEEWGLGGCSASLN